MRSDALADAKEAKLSIDTDTGKIEIIDIEALQTAIKSLGDKANVQKSLKEYKLIQDDKSVVYSKRLDQFKRKPGNAAFVTPNKQKQGLYSAEAEWRKSNNLFVTQFSL